MRNLCETFWRDKLLDNPKFRTNKFLDKSVSESLSRRNFLHLMGQVNSEEVVETAENAETIVLAGVNSAESDMEESVVSKLAPINLWIPRSISFFSKS